MLCTSAYLLVLGNVPALGATHAWLWVQDLGFRPTSDPGRNVDTVGALARRAERGGRAGKFITRRPAADRSIRERCKQ
jgi:hypothetical protein